MVGLAPCSDVIGRIHNGVKMCVVSVVVIVGVSMGVVICSIVMCIAVLLLCELMRRVLTVLAPFLTLMYGRT